MTVIDQPNELVAPKVCLAIGVFDGVHLGHQQVLRQTMTDAHQHGACAVAITFDRHPNTVVAPQRTPGLIYSLPQKLRSIASLGIDSTLLIRFDRAFSEKSAEAFVQELARDFRHIHSVCVGASFTFGHKRGGNVTLLKTLGTELKFTVHGLAAVSLDGKAVSSTRIREAIREGNIDLASQMLGRPYSIAGRVVHGDELGRQLGAPTANLEIGGLILPPNGVYAAHAQAQGQTFPAAVNIGVRPTLQNPTAQVRVEAHLVGFDGDLYDQELEVIFVEKLRDEQRFSSVEDLKKQIQDDIASTRELLR